MRTSQTASMLRSISIVRLIVLGNVRFLSWV